MSFCVKTVCMDICAYALHTEAGYLKPWSSLLVTERLEERHTAVDVELPTIWGCDGATLSPSTQRLDMRGKQKRIFYNGENQELKEQNILRGPLKSYHFYPTSVFVTMIANTFLTINSDSTANVWNCINEELSACLYPSII